MRYKYIINYIPELDKTSCEHYYNIMSRKGMNICKRGLVLSKFTKNSDEVYAYKIIRRKDNKRFVLFKEDGWKFSFIDFENCYMRKTLLSNDDKKQKKMDLVLFTVLVAVVMAFQGAIILNAIQENLYKNNEHISILWDVLIAMSGAYIIVMILSIVVKKYNKIIMIIYKLIVTNSIITLAHLLFVKMLIHT